MKAKRIFTAFLSAILTINIIVPVSLAETDPYEGLPDTGMTIISNDQLVSKIGTNGEVDWSQVKTQYVTTDYGRTLQIKTKVKNDANMDIAVPFNVNGDFATGDVGVISFMGRSTSSTEGQLASADLIYQQSSSPWDKMVKQHSEFTSEWQRYNFPFVARNNFPASTSEFIFWVGYYPQEIQIADFSLINYKNQVAFEDLTGYAADSYKGREENAEWREAAFDRIETYRKGDMNIHVKSPDGGIVKNADINVYMTRNKFNFGTAVTDLLWQKEAGSYTITDCLRYKNAFNSNFNTAVLEGALKWNEYNSTNGNDADKTVAYLKEVGKAVRGHCLYWDRQDWFNLASGTTVAEKKESILNHVAEMASKYPEVYQWDVINEPLTERYLRTNSDYGISFMADIFKTAAENTNAKLYLNELGIQGNDSGNFNRMKSFIPELKEAGARVDGLGIETHCGNEAPSPEDYYNELCELGEYVDELSVTEYDIDVDDEQLAADNLRDMLIAAYSMPKVNSFLVWGFWDRKHWLSNAPFYKSVWTEKKALSEWRKYVVDTWTTDEYGTTDENGDFFARGYLGTYDITVNYDGQEYVTENVKLDSNAGCNIVINLGSEPDVSQEEILSAGTVIVNNGDLLALTKNSDGEIGATEDGESDLGDLKYFDKETNDNFYAYQNSFGKCEGIKYSIINNANYSSPKDANISIPFTTAISQGDIILVSFNAQEYCNKQDALAYLQIAIDNVENQSYSDVISMNETFGWNTTWEFGDKFYVPIIATSDFNRGGNLEICVGFNNNQMGFVGNLEARNLGQDYTLLQVKKAFGLETNTTKLDAPYTINDGKTVTFAATANLDQNLDYAVALYNGNKLVDVKLLEDIATSRQAKNLAAAFDAPGTYTSAKIMAFEDISGLNALCNSIETTK